MIGILAFGKILDKKLVLYLSYGVSIAGFIQAIFLVIFVKKFLNQNFYLILKFQKR